MMTRKEVQEMKIEVRSDSVHVEGYVNAVGRDSRRLTDDEGYPFYEQMEPGVFARALATGSPVEVLLNHDRNRVLGSTNDALSLNEDSIGLFASFDSRDAELIELARGGHLLGWSFGFIPLDHTDVYDSAVGHRAVVKEIDLREVSVISDAMRPCYAGTSIYTRADGEDEQIQTRSMDNDAVFRVILEEPATNKEPIDYSRYDAVINRVKR